METQGMSLVFFPVLEYFDWNLNYIKIKEVKLWPTSEIKSQKCSINLPRWVQPRFLSSEKFQQENPMTKLHMKRSGRFLFGFLNSICGDVQGKPSWNSSFLWVLNPSIFMLLPRYSLLLISSNFSMYLDKLFPVTTTTTKKNHFITIIYLFGVFFRLIKV